MRNSLTVVLLAAALTACNSHPVAEPVCGTDGIDVRLPSERNLCVYRHEIVIETGFLCPKERTDLFVAAPHFGTCSSFGPPIGIDRDFLFDRYGVAGRPWPTAEPSRDELPRTQSLDLLWVIDNSGSMCQEQAQLRANFEGLIAGLAADGTDFHMAVTTTDMNPDYALEPVARPGVIQSRPQPVPGFDRSCHTATDEMGMQIDGDYSPIRQSLEIAVGCMADPDPALLEATNAEIECALYASPQGCVIARAGCGGAGPPCTPEHLFPDPDSYRRIPKVLRSEEYRANGELDVAAVTADFGCASLVGTRGYGIEKGLAAAAAAVAPETIEADNDGFLRDAARFAVMFVSDENDCTHDGTLREDTACGGDVCEYWNREELLGGPLVPVAQIKAQLLGNLSTSKGRVVSEAEVFVGSIHGQSRRYMGEMPTESQCGAPEYSGLEPSCATALGVAYSGDRYDRFVAQFRDAFPRPTADGSTAGLLCRGDFSPALTALADWFGAAIE